MLRQELEIAEAQGIQRREAAEITVEGAATGLCLTFEALPGFALAPSVEYQPSGIRLLNLKTIELEGGAREEATVFVPDGKLTHFYKGLAKYVQTSPKQPYERRSEALFDPMERIRLATLEGLWTDRHDDFPSDPDQKVWWEAWLRRDGHRSNADALLAQYFEAVGAYVQPRALRFKDRVVIYVHASRTQLAGSIDVLGVLAELRRPAEVGRFFESLSPAEQRPWIDDMVRGLSLPGEGSPAVTLLDTGVNRGHPLLSPFLPQADMHTCHPHAGAHDHHGHGTEMAGLALFGDLAEVLPARTPPPLTHGLESVMVIPPGGNAPEHYGAVTVEAVAQAESAAPERQRVVSLAISAGGRTHFGEPTGWSAAIDALATGRAVDAWADGVRYLDDDLDGPRRLVVLSAGNVLDHDPAESYLDRCATAPVEDPGQAWNAITVGAFTQRAAFQSPGDWRPMAEPGELSPHSRTGLTYLSKWPNKPDVVFEGGNIAMSPSGDLDEGHPDLTLLTTSAHLTRRMLTFTWATSAATAQVARLAAMLMAEHPTRWPETIRALIVHSAQWSPQMLSGLGRKPKRSEAGVLLRTYGMGVSDLDRAARSAKDALTLVSEAIIRPYQRSKSGNGFREMHLYALPWPREVLSALGHTQVRLRVTLSYFVEPNPGRRGWRSRHRYASHGLRFDVKGANESVTVFKKRMNKAALDEESERRPKRPSDDSGWFLGTDNRERGSLHADVWRGAAAELATRDMLAVCPVTGWWKEQPRHDRSDLGVRYALVVSIETDAQDVDLWTPVAVQLHLPVATLVEVE